jgi:hypothetical protein
LAWFVLLLSEYPDTPGWIAIIGEAGKAGKGLKVSAAEWTAGFGVEPVLVRVFADFCLRGVAVGNTVKASGNLRDAEQCSFPWEVGSAA